MVMAPSPASNAADFRMPYAQASALRWEAFRAGRLRAMELADEGLGARGAAAALEAHVHELRVLGLPAEALDPPVADEATGVQPAASAAQMVVAEAMRAAAEAFTGEEQRGLAFGAAADDVATGRAAMLGVARGCGQYWGFVACGNRSAAQRALALGLRDFHFAHWSRPAWRGANLGGWLLLEPGPASPFYDVCREKIAKARRSVDLAEKEGGVELPELDDESEHCLCAALEEAGGPSLRKELFENHRASHFNEETFDNLVAVGLNAVRVPFGYWVVRGAGEGMKYEGPCLDALDRAVALAASRGMQVLLDLHGNPGGESGDRPSGCVDRTWRWTSWQWREAVSVLAEVAARYKDSECVTGLQVCNEPSMSIPADILCTFYEEALEAIRGAGMQPDRVAIVLPVFNHNRLLEITNYWQERGNFLRYDNVAFDLHYYHTFSSFWNFLSHAQHIDVVAEHARELAQLPGAVVGEWSLARPSDFPDQETSEFAEEQVLAYNHSTHGWFFWNWHDHDFLPTWDMRRGVFERGRLPKPLGTRLTEGCLFPEWRADPWTAVPDWPRRSFWPRAMSVLPPMMAMLGRVQYKCCSSRN
mmetsp:Transcript_66762/g.186175  ORF Transcript_66762/g.186175 Transcript_66762/m.186175 type:complete len:590 (-) Transcript_66762:105-1874(-)